MQAERNGHASQQSPADMPFQKKTAPQKAAPDQSPTVSPMPVLPLAPLNQQENLVWWGTRMPARAGFAPEVRELVESLASHVPFPLRADRLKLRALGAIHAAEAFEEGVRQVESDTAAKRDRVQEALQNVEVRLKEVGAQAKSAQDELRETQKTFAACAGMAGIFLQEPIGVTPMELEAALARRLPCGAEAAGAAGTAAAEEKSATHESGDRWIHLLTSIATGIMLSLSLGTLCGILKSSELHDPSPAVVGKVGISALIGFATEYMLGKYGRCVAYLVFLHRDGQQVLTPAVLPGGGRLTWPLAALLAICYGMLSLLEGLGLRDLHQQVAGLLGTRDPMPLIAYCLVGGAIGGTYLWSHTATAYAEWHNAARLAFQAHVRREAREAWLRQEDGKETIRLAHLIPFLKAEIERLAQEWVALCEERERLADPRPSADALAALQDEDENARGERAEFKHDLNELVEVLEPLEKK